METGADFEQTGDATSKANAAFSRFRDAAENFQKRRFACAIASDDPDNFPFRNIEGDIPQSPEFFNGPFLRRATRQAPEGTFDALDEILAQSAVSLIAQPFVANRVFLSKIVNADHRRGHRAPEMHSAGVSGPEGFRLVQADPASNDVGKAFLGSTKV